MERCSLVRGFAPVFLFFACATSLPTIRLEGFAPPGIEVQELEQRYRDIYATIAPNRNPDRTPLSVRYVPTTELGPSIFDSFHAGGEEPRREYGLPEWGGGGAIGRDLAVIMLSRDPFLDQNPLQVTTHELVHSVLARAFPRLSIPRWFHEGLAMTLAGEVSFAEQAAVSKAIFTANLVNLPEIEEVNGFPRQRAFLAYSQSHHAVVFLVNRFGVDGIAEILAAAAKSGSFWEGMHTVLSITEAEFAAMVRTDLVARYRLVFLIADTYLVWAGLTILFLVGLVVTRLRNRKKAALMEAAETAAPEQDQSVGDRP